MKERWLAERGLDETYQTLDLLPRTLRNPALVDKAGQSVLNLITEYAHTWRPLLEYDEDRLRAPTGTKPWSPFSVTWSKLCSANLFTAHVSQCKRRNENGIHCSTMYNRKRHFLDLVPASTTTRSFEIKHVSDSKVL